MSSQLTEITSRPSTSWTEKALGAENWTISPGFSHPRGRTTNPAREATHSPADTTRPMPRRLYLSCLARTMPPLDFSSGSGMHSTMTTPGAASRLRLVVTLIPPRVPVGDNKVLEVGQSGFNLVHPSELLFVCALGLLCVVVKLLGCGD